MRKDKSSPPPPHSKTQYDSKPAVKLPSLIPYKEELWPKKVKRSKQAEKAGRPWRVDYALTYEGGQSTFWQYYRTRQGAILSAFFYKFVRSYGGTAILVHQPTESHDKG
jgi:hypothetical protein